MDAPPSSPIEPADRRDLIRGWIALVLGLAPSLAAIGWVPAFSTQDGPAHLYNARILNASLRPESPYATTFEVAWQPLPNWSGHLGTMALVALLPPDRAARAMTAITMVALASSVVWLRWSVAGPKGLATAAILASLLALNVTWLLGFTSFLLGAALLPATLAVWWGGRDRFGATRALGLSVLLVLGYFSHPISLGLTLVGLFVLVVLTPGPDRGKRAIWTALGSLPMVPLGLAYRSMTRSGGGLEPVWEHLANPWSPRSWFGQIAWVDPITLASKTLRPFGPTASAIHGLASPALWTIAAVGLLAFSTIGKPGRDRRAWLVMGGLFLFAGLVGPDTLGVKHGHYLPQRVVLLGLVAIVPWLDLGGPRRLNRLASLMLGFALVVQSAFVWEYAIDCRDRLGQLARAGQAIGPGKRVGTLLTGIKGRFRANPMLHADCLLGVEDGRVIWSNYETAHYYFPVKVRAGLEHPPALGFERVALLDGPDDRAERAGLWGEMLADHGESIDVIVEWSPRAEPTLDAINARRYDSTFQDGPVRVWTRRDPPGP